MKLVYEKDGKEVQIGDAIDIGRTPEEEEVEVVYFRPPHKSSSSGKVTVKWVGKERTQEFYVGVIGAEWIEREDRGWTAETKKLVTASTTFVVQDRTDPDDEVRKEYRDPSKPLEVMDSDNLRACFVYTVEEAEEYIRGYVEDALGLTGGVALGHVKIESQDLILTGTPAK